MSRPLNAQPGHAYAPGVTPEREPSWLELLIAEIIAIVAPMATLLVSLAVILVLLMMIPMLWRRWRHNRRIRAMEAALLAQQEELEAAAQQPGGAMAPVRPRRPV